MNTLSSTQSIPAGVRQSKRSELVTGILVGLIPLGLLIAAILLTLALTNTGLLLTASLAFSVREQIMLVLSVSGLIVMILAYGIGCIAVMRRIKRWQEAGMSSEAHSALWMLAATALLLLLPLLLAVLL